MILNRKKIIEIYKTLLLFVIIVFSTDTLFGGVVLNVYKSTAIVFIINIPVFIYFLKSRVNANAILTMILLTGIIGISILVKHDFKGLNFLIVFSIILSCALTSFYSLNDIIKKYTKIMFWLCVYSLITTYFIKYIIIKSGIVFPIIENSSGLKLYNFIFSYAVTKSFYIRNFGVFREAGVYQIFISIALIFEIFFNENKNKKKIFIFIISMISTFSTIAVINLVIICLNYFTKIAKTKGSTILRNLFLGVVSVIILGIIIINNLNFRFYFYSSLQKLQIDEFVNNARYESFGYVMKKIIEHPLIGNKSDFSIGILNNNTTTTLSFFAIYGIIFGISHFLLLYLFLNKSQERELSKISLLVVILISINAQYIPYNVFLWLVMFSGFMKYDREVYKNENTMDC